ncbi:MAG: hypothetical protein ABSD42_09520 [Candidatus Bathyarchaeia archaeon]|jgi:hypothetical protein
MPQDRKALDNRDETMQVTALTIVFVAVIIILSLVTIKTVIPDSQASKLNLVGYRTCCPFAPVSTVIGIALVITLFLVARRMAVM